MLNKHLIVQVLILAKILYNKKQAKFNYCLKLHAYFGNVIIGFLMQIFLDIWENSVVYSTLLPEYR